MTAQLSKKAEAWSARFNEPVSDLVKRYTASVFFDKRLAKADIQGSLAHAEMLAAQGIISAQDRADIERGMAQIAAEIEAGQFEWLLDLEDVHLNIEKRLTELQREKETLERSFSTVMVMAERPVRKETHLLIRGA